MYYNYYDEFHTIISSLNGVNTKLDSLYTILCFVSVALVGLIAFNIIKNWRFTKK